MSWDAVVHFLDNLDLRYMALLLYIVLMRRSNVKQPRVQFG